MKRQMASKDKYKVFNKEPSICPKNIVLLRN